MEKRALSLNFIIISENPGRGGATPGCLSEALSQVQMDRFLPSRATPKLMNVLTFRNSF